MVLHSHQIWPDEECAGIDIFRFDALALLKVARHQRPRTAHQEGRDSRSPGRARR
ncbi:hypothetical protein ACWEWX_08050 [Streptomyces asiaticus]